MKNNDKINDNDVEEAYGEELTYVGNKDNNIGMLSHLLNYRCMVCY